MTVQRQIVQIVYCESLSISALNLHRLPVPQQWKRKFGFSWLCSFGSHTWKFQDRSHSWMTFTCMLTGSCSKSDNNTCAHSYEMIWVVYTQPDTSAQAAPLVSLTCMRTLHWSSRDTLHRLSIIDMPSGMLKGLGKLGTSGFFCSADGFDTVWISHVRYHPQ